MLDINFIRENTELVEKSTKEKGYKNVDIKALLKLDDERKEALKVVEDCGEFGPGAADIECIDRLEAVDVAWVGHHTHI